MKRAVFWGSLHFVNDFLAGYILASLNAKLVDVSKIGLWVLIYNLIAFGGQPVFVLLAYTRARLTFWFITLLALLALGLFLFQTNNVGLSILCLGCSSILVHVIGSIESLGGKSQASLVGIFASPGVMGLALGGYCAIQFVDVSLPCYITMATMVFVYTFFYKNTKDANVNSIGYDTSFHVHDLLMIILLFIIAMRSAIWNTIQQDYIAEPKLMLLIAFAAMLGKVVGGVMSQIWNAKKFTILALALSFPFILFFKKNIILFCIGVFFLQSSFPPMVCLMLENLRKHTAVLLSLAFGVSIVLGGGLYYISIYIPEKIFVASILIVSMILLVGIDKVKTWFS